jgi:hypothetical protein
MAFRALPWQGEVSPVTFMSGGAERRLSLGKLFALTVASFRGSDAPRRVPTIVNWGEATTKVAPDAGGRDSVSGWVWEGLLGAGSPSWTGV